MNKFLRFEELTYSASVLSLTMILNKSYALFHQGIRRICMSCQMSQSNTIILKSRSHVPLRRGDMQGKTPNLFCIFSWVALCWTPLCIFIWHSEIADKKGASVMDEEFYWLIDNSASFPCIYIQTICSGSGLRRICMSASFPFFFMEYWHNSSCSQMVS
jgi:hypothetical protein